MLEGSVDSSLAWVKPEDGIQQQIHIKFIWKGIGGGVIVY
jgi:hypothetical protein